MVENELAERNTGVNKVTLPPPIFQYIFCVNTLNICIHGSYMGLVKLFEVCSLSKGVAQVVSNFVMSFHYIPCTVLT